MSETERYGLFASFRFDAGTKDFAAMNRVVAGLRGIEEATRETEESLQSARLGQEVRRQMRSAAGSTSTLERPLKALRQEFRALRAESRNIDFGDLGDTRQFKAATQQVHQYVDALESLGNQIEHNTSLEREFAAVVKRQQRIAQERIDMAEQQRKAAVAAQRLAGAQAVQQIGQAVAAPLGAMGRDSIKILSDFNDQMAQVAAVSDMTAKQLSVVRQRAKELGASTRFSASDAASGFVLLAQAGYDVNQQLKAIDGTLNLASAGNLDLARATEITVSTLGQFQLDADKAAHAANVLAQAAAMGQLDVTDIGESLKYAGVSAKRAGLNLEQTASMLALLSEGGLKGEMAGSALGQMLDGLVAPASTGAAALRDLGVETTDATGALLPYEKILGSTIKALSKVSDESERAALQNKIFGVVGGRAAGILTPRYERIAKATDEIARSADAGVGAAIKQSRIMEDTLGGSFRNFSSAMEGLKISLIEPLEPIIRAIVDTGSAVANFFSGLPGPIRGVISVGMGLTFVLAGLAAALATVGIAAFGMQQTIATSSVGLLALRSSAIPLTGFFETAMRAFSGSGLAGLQRFTADLSLLPGPLGQVMVLIRGVGMAITTTPFGMAIAGFAAILALAEVLTPGIDLLGTTVTLLVAPFRILGGLAGGIFQGFGTAIDEISGNRLGPVAQDFVEFTKKLIDQIDSLEMSANSLGQSIGKAIANGLAPIFTVQAAVSRTIFSIWRGTITAITRAFDPLVRFAQWVGQMLVSRLAENSPGPTAQIRQRWDETVQHVQDAMVQLVATAQQVGEAVFHAFSFVAEGIARLFREVFGHLLVNRLVKQTGVLGVRIHNRVFGLLNEILTLPVELGNPATMFFDGLLTRLTSIEEILVAITPAMRVAFVGVVPVTMQAQLTDINNSLINYIRSLGGAEGVVMRWVGSFDRLLKVASFLLKVVARYPGIVDGLGRGLMLLGRLAGVAGLILSLSDTLRTLSFLAQGLQRVLTSMGVPSDWLTPVITGLNRTIEVVQSARQAFVGFARDLLYGNWGAVAQGFSDAWIAAVGTVQRMLGSPLLADLQVFSTGAMKSVLESQKTWINSLQANVSGAIANPVVLLAAGIKAGKKLGKAISTGLIKQVDGVAKKLVSEFSSRLNATSGAAMSVALLSLFFAPAGIPRLVAGFAPALVVALTNSGVLQGVQAWVVKAFGGLVQKVDQAFGRQEWLHRLGEAFGVFDVIAKGTGTVIGSLAKNMTVRLGVAIGIVMPAVQSLIDSFKEIYQIGGIPAVLQNLQVITQPLALALQQITSLIQQMGMALAGLAATSPLFRGLMASIGAVANLLMRIPLMEQLGAFAVSLGLSRRLMGVGQSAISAGQQGGKVAVGGMQQVIQLMLWIGQGVYQIAEPAGTSLKRVPGLLSRILGVASKILNPLPALVSLSGRATGAGGTPRITPVDILSQFLPEFLIPATEKAIAGTKVRKILAAKQPGFEEFDPFKQRELVGRYVERLSNPLGLINTPLFGPVVMASIELVGGSLLGLIATVGLVAGALYVFKPELAKPMASFFQILAKGVVGLAFVLVRLGHSSREAADSIDVLGLKLKAPGWAIFASKALNAVVGAVGAVAVALTNVVDFTLGIIPTLIRSTLYLVVVAFTGMTALILQSLYVVLSRIRNDTMRLGDAIVAGVRQGDWTQLGSILKEAFMNALNVTLVPIARLVKYIAWDLIISPISSAVWWAFTTVANAIGSVLLHPIRTINFLVNAIKAIGVAVASIRLVGLLQAFTRVSAVVYEFESAVGGTGVAIAATATVASVALGPIIALVMGAVVAIGILVQGYRDKFKTLTELINTLQWMAGYLQWRIEKMIEVIATPVKPFDWLFKPISDFLSGAGDQFTQWFPTILAAFLGLQIARKGLVGGFVSAFTIISKAILSVVSAISQAITGMIKLGGKTREFSQTLEGEVIIEQTRRIGQRAGRKFGLFRNNESPAIQAERDQQFLEKSAIVRFRKSVQQTLKKTGDSIGSISEDTLKQLAEKARLDTSGVPGVVPLRELAARDSGQLEEIRDLYQQNIDNLKTADMRAQTVTLVSDKVEASNVVSISRGTVRKLSTPEDVSSLRFGAAELRALANMPGGEGLRSGAGLSQEASRLEITLGEASKRLEDIPLSVMKNLAQAVGVYQPRTSRDEDYRFLNTYKDHLDKQGLPGVQKQLLMLQVLARTDQIPTPEALTKGIVSAEDALKAIHGALEHLYRAANAKGDGQADAYNQMALDTLKGQLPFLTNQDVASVIQLLDKNPNPDRIMQAVRQVLDTQVDLFLEDSPIFTPVQEAAKKMEQVVQTTAAEAIAEMPKGGLWSGLGKRLKVAVRDFMDSDRVKTFVEGRQQQRQQREIAAMREQRRLRISSIQQNSGASNQLEFLRRIGAIQDPTTQMLEQREGDVAKALGVQPDTTLLNDTIKTLSTAKENEIRSKLDPAVVKSLEQYSEKTLGIKVDNLLKAMRAWGKGNKNQKELEAFRGKFNFTDKTLERFRQDFGQFNAQSLERFLMERGIGAPEMPKLDAVAKQYLAVAQKYLPDISALQAGLFEDVSKPVQSAIRKYIEQYGMSLEDFLLQVQTAGFDQILTELRQSGAIKEIASPDAVFRLFRQVGVEPPKTSLNTPEAKAALQILKGELRNLNDAATQAVLRQIAQVGGIEVAELIDPTITGAKLGQARQLRQAEMIRRAGVGSMSELTDTLNVSTYGVDQIAAGRFYRVSQSEMERAAKGMGFGSTSEMEQMLSATELLSQQGRAGMMSRTKSYLAEVSGVAGMRRQQQFSQSALRLRQELRESTPTIDPRLVEQQRRMGLDQALATRGVSRREFAESLGYMGTTETFENFLATGEWIQKASQEQIDLLHKESFGKAIGPHQLDQLKRTLEKQNLTETLIGFLKAGRFVKDDLEEQEKLFKAFSSTIGGNFGKQQLDDLEYLLRDQGLTQYLMAYLKTGKFLVETTEKDRKSIASMLFGSGADIQQLETLEELVPSNAFEQTKLQAKLFFMDLRGQFVGLRDSIELAIQGTPVEKLLNQVKPAVKGAMKQYDTFRAITSNIASGLSKNMESVKRFRAIQENYRIQQSRSLQTMIEQAGIGSLDDFVQQFRARMEQKGIGQKNIDQEILAILSPGRAGLRSTAGKGGESTRDTTLKVMADLLNLAGKDRERIGAAGGYTAQAAEPFQIFFSRQLPSIVLAAARDFANASRVVTERAGILGVKAALRIAGPRITQQIGGILRNVGFGLTDGVNRIREFFAGTRLSNALLPLQNVLELRTKQIGKFLDQEAKAIAQQRAIAMKPADRFKQLVTTMLETLESMVNRINSVVQGARTAASPFLDILSDLFRSTFGRLSGVFSQVANAIRGVVSRAARGAGDIVRGGMEGRYRRGGLMEVEQQQRDNRLRPTDTLNFREQYGNDGIRLRSTKGNPAGRFLDEGISTGVGQALFQVPEQQRAALPPAPPPPITSTPIPRREYPMLLDPWEETNSERFFKGLAQITRSLKRQLPEVSEQTVEFFRTINRDGERSLERIKVVPLYRRMLMAAAGGARNALNQATTFFDRRAGVDPPKIQQQPQQETRIAGLLPPAKGTPMAAQETLHSQYWSESSKQQTPLVELYPELNTMTGKFAKFLVDSAEKVEEAWRRSGQEITGRTGRDMIRRLLPAARELVAPSQNIGNTLSTPARNPVASSRNSSSEFERGIWLFGSFYPTRDIEAAWQRTTDTIRRGIWPRLVQSAKQVGRKILSFIAENSPGPTAEIRERYHETANSVVADMHHMEAAAARTGQKIKHSLVGGIGRAGVAIFGALSATGFATQSIASSLTSLGILDEATGDALYKFTEIFSIVGAIGSLAAPLFGAVAATLGALIPIITTVGGAIGTFLIGPIGLASGAIIGSLLLINEATKRLFGVDFIAPVIGRVMLLANAIRQPLDWAANWIEARWQQFRDRFAPILAPIVEPALEVAQQLINALNHNPTEVIPLAWEEAVKRIIEWISQLPGIGKWAAKQLNKVMEPGGTLSRWGATVKRWFSDLSKSPAGEAIAPTKKELPPLPPPPKVTAAEQWGDMMSALQRSGDPSQVLTPGLDKATYGFQFLMRSARQFGEESGVALKQLDFGALTKSAKSFGDRFLLAANIVGQGFGSMTMGALAFGVTSLLSLGPVILALGGIGLAALAIATNFLGIRTIVVGTIRAIVGIAQILASTLKGLIQITTGFVRVLAGAIAMLGGNFEMIHHGIAQVVQGIQVMASGVGQGLRNAIGGAAQMLRGALQGLGQVARFTLGAMQRSGVLIATTFRQIILLAKGIGNALLNALTQPQRAWDRFVGTIQQAKNVISRLVQSPRIAADTVALRTGGKAPSIPESYQMAEFDDRLRSIPFVGNFLANQQSNHPERISAISDAFAGLTGILSALSPALATPLMLFSGLLDSVFMMATSIPILKPMFVGFAATLKGMGTAAGFTATMNMILAKSTAFLSGALTIGMVAAKAFWVALTGPLAPVIVAIGLIIAGVWALFQAFNVFGRIGQVIGGIVQVAREAWGIIDRAFRDAFGGIMIALNQLGDAIASPFEPLLQLFGASGGSGLAGLIGGVFRIILNPVLLLAQGIGLIIRLIGAVIAGIIQVGAYVTRTLLSPVAIALEWIIAGIRGIASGIYNSLGVAFGFVANSIRDTFGFIWETLVEVGNSLVEPLEPLLNMFGTSGAGGLVDLLGRGISAILFPLKLLGFAVSLVVRLFGVLLVGAIRIVATTLKPVISAILMPFRMIAAVIQGVVWLLHQIPSLMGTIANSLWNIVPPQLRWLFETAKGMLGGGGTAPTAPAPQRFSTGGLVTGPSGGDVIPALLSNREFVVNQSATRQNIGFLEAINSGVPAEKALGLMQIAPPSIVRLPSQTMTVPADAAAQQPISVQINLTFTGNIMVSGNSGEEVAADMMQHLEPRLQIAIKEALRDMVERMR